MKKLTILGVVFLSMTILFSCGEDAKSDKESEKDKKKDKYKKEIKGPCDIVDYSIEIFEELEGLSDKYDDIDDLEDDKKDKKKVNAYFDDLEDAWKYSFKKFDAEEMMDEVIMGLFMEESVDEVEYFYEERFEDFIDFITVEMNDLQTEYYEGEDAAADPAAAAAPDADYGHAEEYIQYYHIVDPDGWTNMRYNPNGEIIRKVYSDEEFLVLLENEGWSYVMFDDGSSGYIHSSRIHETY